MSMTTDRAERIVERYRSSPVYPKTAGESFGLSVMMWKGRVYDALVKRGMSKTKAYFRTERIYERVMRDRPCFAQYQDARRFLAALKAPSAPPTFTVEELEHLASLWKDANDPISRAIAEKAARMIPGQRGKKRMSK